MYKCYQLIITVIFVGTRGVGNKITTQHLQNPLCTVYRLRYNGKNKRRLYGTTCSKSQASIVSNDFCKQCQQSTRWNIASL